MTKKYFITNENKASFANTSDILFTLLVLLSFIAIMIFICNYFLNYNVDFTIIIILFIIILLCKYILD